ncbi:Z1 domain-containing protein [Arthrobacter sp. APC 3897]|uniref:Z1 domain-containing protein n=1 Tax=Arthrobacter sp. APC 3897 TaxID=3035204 RepID=UPI0025B41E42|nr:Z1 domain-containing protein [Arthrobacter sp. APC 3897]MDN3483677.1 Z1 domain-containing protein [Arthrobacter sp. APC 3897]
MNISVSAVEQPSTDSRVWHPVPGKFTEGFIALKTAGTGAHLESSMGRVVEEAQDILAHCHPPAGGPGGNAVLVVGYVQSGKTLSFTTVAALARDNGYGVVIVLAGTTKNLKKQSEDRLDADLGLTELQGAWTRTENPVADEDGEDIRRILEGWKRDRDGQTLRDKPALLITVLKHSGRIKGTAETLRRLGSVVQGVPVLIIDDESDQASLNTKARQNLIKGTTNKSVTYDAIVELRDALPHHSYLQYTATPQANLLLAITDVLNPAYAKVISSGDSYTGGKFFFQDHAERLIVKLPEKDICNPKSMPNEAPESLLESLRFYLLGAAVTAMNDGPRKNRSMMVQASQDTDPHGTYAKWIQDLVNAWSNLLRTGSQASKDQLRSDFEGPYLDLESTTKSVGQVEDPLPPLDELLGWVAEVCTEVRVLEVNSKGAEKEINWKSDQFWILVGGLKLDRGFTVEGLTVTYMPRNLSENADVLQQRARFFGYRDSYAAYCRIFLSAASIAAFTEYVRDEEYLRRTLIENADRPLTEWRRSFLLSKHIRNLSRSNISGRKIKRLKLDAGWITPRGLHLDVQAAASNDKLMLSYAKNKGEKYGRVVATDVYNVTDRRSGSQPNVLVPSVDLDEVLLFLMDFTVVTDRDRMLMTSITTGLGEANSPVDLVLMSDLSVDHRSGFSSSTIESNIFSGRSPKSLSVPTIYSGDRAYKSEQVPTLQLHRITIKDSPLSSGQLVAPWLALHIPGQLASDFVVEEF